MRTPTKRLRQSAHHRIITMKCPPSSEERKKLAPFTEAVLALPVQADSALVYARKPAERIEIVLSRVRCAIACAARRARKAEQPPKEFAVRKILDGKVETFAVWRLK